MSMSINEVTIQVDKSLTNMVMDLGSSNSTSKRTTCQFKRSSFFHSSEVTSNYDCPLKWTGLLLGNQVHGILPCTGKARQGFQIPPHHGLHLHLLLGHQGEQGDPAGQDQARNKEKPINSQEECKTKTGVPDEEIWHGIQPDTCRER